MPDEHLMRISDGNELLRFHALRDHVRVIVMRNQRFSHCSLWKRSRNALYALVFTRFSLFDHHFRVDSQFTFVLCPQKQQVLS